METPQFPMRINKYLAWKKYSTRKGGDELITKKRVLINKRLAVLGDKVTESDVVEVIKNKKDTPLVYYAYNKPQGIITHSAQGTEKEIKKDISLKGVFPIGRLDKDSHGLMILTNDGRITDRLLNPEYAHEKEYIVETTDKLRSNFKEKMEGGVDIEGYMTKPCKVKIIDDTTFKIILSEGKKHQIRRMCANLFNGVKDLKRIRIMNISLGTLKEGQHRKIEGEELAIFLKNLGI